MGLAPLFVETHLRPASRRSTRRASTILLVEQNAQLALQIADRGYVLESGEIVLEDDAKKLLTKTVRKAYLGEE